MTEGLRPDDLPSSRWLSLYDVCFNFGLFAILLPLRRKAIESAFLEEQKHPHRLSSVKQAFSAAIDQSDFERAEELLPRIERLTQNPEDHLHLSHQVFYLFQKGHRQKAAPYCEQLLQGQENNVAFRRLIEGKRVAVVGPAPNGEVTGQEIDEHDLIVRINYRGADRLGDPKEFGSRTDIILGSNTSMLIEAAYSGVYAIQIKETKKGPIDGTKEVSIDDLEDEVFNAKQAVN